MTDLTGNVALITGAAGGIGSATAREMAQNGASVLIADIDGQKADAIANELRAAGLTAQGLVLDVADREACMAACRDAGTIFGPVSIVVNNAGIAGQARMGDALAPEQWDRSLAINLTGMYNVTTACLADLKETKGNIINISSVVAFTSGFAQAGYAASKGGARTFTQSMCRELAPHGIRVNCVAPGYVDTGMLEGSKLSQLQEWLDFHCPMKRQGRPDEIASVIAFLASSKASFVNGTTVAVDGGYLAI